MNVKRNPPEFVQLNANTAKDLREQLHQEAGGICPVLRMKIPFDKSVLDHKHKRKSDPIGPNGAGLVRGFLDYRVNALEGIFLKKFKKSGLYGVIPFDVLLDSLAKYISAPICPQIFIYPSEKPPAPIMTKRDYDLIVKYYKIIFPRRRKIPSYPKSGIKIKINGNKIQKRYKARLSPKWAKLLKRAKELKNATEKR